MPYRGRGVGAASNGLRRTVLAPKGGKPRNGRALLGTRPDRAPYLTNTSGLRVANEERLKGVDYTDGEERRLVVIFLRSVKVNEANAIYTIAKQLFEY